MQLRKIISHCQFHFTIILRLSMESAFGYMDLKTCQYQKQLVIEQILFMTTLILRVVSRNNKPVTSVVKTINKPLTQR